MATAAEVLSSAIRSVDTKQAEEFRSQFFPQGVSYGSLASRLKPAELDRFQEIDPLVVKTIYQAMFETGIQNFRLERDWDNLVEFGDPNFDYIIRFQAGVKNGSWTEALGFKAIVISYDLRLKKFSASVPLVDDENSSDRFLKLQDALKLAGSIRNGKLVDDIVYFNVYNPINVQGNLRALLDLALVRPTRVPPRF